MQEFIIFFLIAFVIIGSLLWKTAYSFDNVNEDENENDVMPQKHDYPQMPNDYVHNSLRYNMKYNERPPAYLDPHFGSASGGNKVNQYVI